MTAAVEDSFDVEKPSQVPDEPTSYAVLCPDCYTPATSLETAVEDGSPGVVATCDSCETSWTIGERESCVACSKPLGGALAVCYTCLSDDEVTPEEVRSDG